MTDRVLERCGLTASEGESWPIGDIDHDDTLWGEQRHRFRVELHTRDVGGSARTAKDVNDKQVHSATKSRRKLGKHFASIPVTNADGGLLRPRKFLANKINEIRFQLDDLLA